LPSGVGSTPASGRRTIQAGVQLDLVHVPSPGLAGISDIGGHTPMLHGAPPAFRGAARHCAARRCIDRAAAGMPDVPTFAEQA